MNGSQIDDPLPHFLQRLTADVATAGLEMAAGVFSLRHQRWVAGDESEVLPGFGDGGYVLVLPGRQQLLAEAPDGEPDLLAMADVVREWVIDELGHGWPELLDDKGQFVGLLAPAHHGDEIVWSCKEHAVPIGELGLARIARRLSR